MRNPALFPTCVAVLAAAICATGAGTAAAAPSDEGGTRVPMMPKYRGCDYGFHVHPNFGFMQDGHGEAVIRKNGNTVTAQVTFDNTSAPGVHYDVGLIQAPRSAAEPCGPGTPGTAYTGMDLDASGRATVTVQGTIDKGTTGVWVKIDRPGPRSQYPMEVYSSAFLTSV